MTGSRLGLRRWSGCNLHWYAPRFGNTSTFRQVYSEPPRSLRYRLYVPDEQYEPGSRYARDRFGTYVWMWPDCGWEWLAGRPVIRATPAGRLFTRLHDHVHTPHREVRVNIPLEIQRTIVSSLERLDGVLDQIPSYEVTARTDETLHVTLYRHGLWGCRLPLSRWSSELDERWGTGVWQPVRRYSVAAWFNALSPDEEESLRKEIATEVTVSRDDPTKVRVSWIEPGVDPRAALSAAREALEEVGLATRANLVWPIEFDPVSA